MANDTAVDQQQLQSTIDELYTKLSELFPAQRDALRNALNTINVGENQALGLLAAADDLATAPVGDQATLLNSIGLGVLSGALNAADLAAFRAAIGVTEFDPNTLGGLAQLNTLSAAQVGDAGTLRTNLGLGALALLGALSDADVGDAATLRNNMGLGSAAVQSDDRYPKLTGGADANFSIMPRVENTPVVESGSNANGTYIKWADGTLVCSAIKTSNVNFSETAGNLYRSPAGDFTGEWPAAFTSITSINSRIVVFASDSGSTRRFDAWATTGNADERLTSYNICFISTSSSGATLRCSTTAWGTWK